MTGRSAVSVRSQVTLTGERQVAVGAADECRLLVGVHAVAQSERPARVGQLLAQVARDGLVVPGSVQERLQSQPLPAGRGGGWGVSPRH